MKQFLQCQKAATALEYGLIAAGISIAVLGALFLFGDSLQALFDRLAAGLTD